MAEVAVRLPLGLALAIAESIRDQLAPYCERIEIAGSIRRRAESIGDVELLVIPKLVRRQLALFDDFATDQPPVDLLHEALEDLEHHLEIRKRRDSKGRSFWGPSDKRILWRYGASSTDWIAVDVFGATSSTWGAKLAIRTGPWQLSKLLVTHRGKGGLLAHDLEFRAGGLYRYEDGGRSARRHFVATPTEHDLFRELGLPYIEPALRTAGTFVGVRR
jgi:DNA polymerase/3'-5' exonuclease PolX